MSGNIGRRNRNSLCSEKECKIVYVITIPNIVILASVLPPDVFDVFKIYNSRIKAGRIDPHMAGIPA
jgi:hypothetical protein